MKKGSAVATVRIGQANTSGIQNADEVLVFFSSACILSIFNMSVGSFLLYFGLLIGVLVSFFGGLFLTLLIGQFFFALSSLLGFGAPWDRDALVILLEHLDRGIQETNSDFKILSTFSRLD